MYSSNNDYLTNLLDFSEEVEGIEMSFVDKDLETFYVKESHLRDIGKSKSFFVLVILGYLIAITISIGVNHSLTRTAYIIMSCMVIEIVLFIISRFVLERYLIFRIFKYARFMLFYFSIFLLIMFPVNTEKINIIRFFYLFFVYINVLFTYYVEFNYIMIIFVPFFNSFLIIFVQYYYEFDRFFFLTELVFNLFYYYAVFIIKKYEFLLNKKLFYEIYKNNQYINYIKQMIDVINTHVICINKEEVLFMNNLANKFFEKNKFSIQGSMFHQQEESQTSGKSSKKHLINDNVFSFFKSLRVINSEYLLPNYKGKSLYDILISLFKDHETNSQSFTSIGYFSDIKTLYSFEIYVRKLRMKQNVIEILLYDISDIRNAEKIKVESMFKRRILAKIAHEFKTPLITIISLINRIINQQQDVNLDHNNITVNLYHIENLSNYTLTLIGDITQYVSDSVNLNLYKKEINIKSTIEFSHNVLDTLIQCNENKVNRVQTKLIFKDGVDKIKVISDENRLKQILLNFISNAYKFTLNGFIKIKAKLIPKDHEVEISVKDSGFGIKEEKQHLVFQEFTQFNISNEYNSKGTGLGLSICKQISDILKHKIGFRSKYGKGSKFYIRIGYRDAQGSEDFNNTISFKNPIHTVVNDLQNSKSNVSETILIKEHLLYGNHEKEDESFLTKSNQYNLIKSKEIQNINIYDLISDRELLNSQNSSLNNGEIHLNEENYKIVVIDDQQLVRENTVRLIKNVLQSLNLSSEFSIIEGSDGIELLNIIRLDKYNMIKCIFIDENMEYLNGSETVGIIRKLEQSSKIRKFFIVSVTGLDDLESKEKLLKSGLDFIIPKPCSKTDLINIFLEFK